MRRRLDSLEKIGALRKQLHDAAMWRLAELERRRDLLGEERSAMWRAMGGEGLAAYGQPAASALRRIRRLEQEIAALKTQCEAQSRHALDQGVRSKLADRAREGVEAKYRDQQQRRELADLIERTLRKPPSSSA
jgi:hypothetical protein